MSNRVNTWVVSDTHFNHYKLIENDLRPKDFQEQIIKKWNRNVKDEDLVIHLGDVIFAKSSELRLIISLLKGTKILVRGNHDEAHSDSFFMKAGFSFVCDYFVNKGCLFSHKPMWIDPYYFKDVKYNIHGHFHDYKANKLLIEPELAKILTDGHYLVSLEETNYMPVSLDSIISKLNKRGFTV